MHVDPINLAECTATNRLQGGSSLVVVRLIGCRNLR